jgi:hypothetical protein
MNKCWEGANNGKKIHCKAIEYTSSRDKLANVNNMLLHKELLEQVVATERFHY